jgi:DNA-nicking Smr family endonuclease
MPENSDDEVWAAYTKAVKPIRGEKKIRVSPPTKKGPKTSGLPSKKEPLPHNPKQLPAPLFDRRMERRLRQGEVEIDARLDLHGMRQDEAYSALGEFIARQVKAGHRTLLVITGKGRNGPGVLRSSLAGWLAASPQASQILALRPASIRHGGDGAFYVILKRRGKSLKLKE